MQVHQLGAVADGRYYVVMDCVDGCDLWLTLTRPAPPPLELALLVGEELARALDYVHRATDEAGRPLGLVHRDVRPFERLDLSRGRGEARRILAWPRRRCSADITRRQRAQRAYGVCIA